MSLFLFILLLAVSAKADLEPPSSVQIIVQPVKTAALSGSNALFFITAAGTDPLYQWQYNGEDIPGETRSNLVLTSVSASNAGFYRVIVHNAFSTETSRDAALLVTTLGETLNATNLSWSVGGTAPIWLPEVEVTHDGEVALQSAPFTRAFESRSISTTVQGPCTISFWWKFRATNTSSSATFQVDSTTSLLKGYHDWERVVYYLGSNSHNLAWTVYDNGGNLADQITLWLD
ncbi:MAG TPA: hypothetical protein VMZ27_11910, partial [Candidatus Saccharimonadales bacterium]|nr:hypothetical protein [Candidatus Saccharimonadales bacterium]